MGILTPGSPARGAFFFDSDAIVRELAEIICKAWKNSYLPWNEKDRVGLSGSWDLTLQWVYLVCRGVGG